MLNELDIINAALASVGLAQVASVDNAHPAVKIARRCLNDATSTFQSEGWWFNEYERVLKAQENGEVVVPTSAIAFDADQPQYIIRDNKLMDKRTGLFSIGTDVAGRMLELLPIGDLPPLAKVTLRAATVYAFYAERNGTEPKLSAYGQAFRDSYLKLVAEDIKHRGDNFFERRQRHGNSLITERYSLRVV